MAQEQRSPRGHDLKERAREELRKFFFISAYLFVCFLAVLLHRMVLLGGEGLHSLPLGFAVGKALVMGKFLLIGEAVHVGTGVRARTLLQRIGYRAVLMLLALLALTLLEEIVVGWFHHRTVGQTLAEIMARTFPVLLTDCLLMLLILVPLIAFVEIDGALGAGTLRRLLFAPPAVASGTERDRA
jgi:hypothetical protein